MDTSGVDEELAFLRRFTEHVCGLAPDGGVPRKDFVQYDPDPKCEAGAMYRVANEACWIIVFRRRPDDESSDPFLEACYIAHEAGHFLIDSARADWLERMDWQKLGGRALKAVQGQLLPGEQPLSPDEQQEILREEKAAWDQAPALLEAASFPSKWWDDFKRVRRNCLATYYDGFGIQQPDDS